MSFSVIGCIVYTSYHETVAFSGRLIKHYMNADLQNMLRVAFIWLQEQLKMFGSRSWWTNAANVWEVGGLQ
jgi:hypothetical protein